MKISIKNLTLEAIIGITKKERLSRQKIVVSLSLEYDYTDNESYIDYTLIRNMIIDSLRGKKFFLLEDALQSISEHIARSFPSTKTLHLEISKPEIFSDCVVSVSTNFSR